MAKAKSTKRAPARKQVGVNAWPNAVPAVKDARDEMVAKQKNAWTPEARAARKRASAAPEPFPDNDPNPPPQIAAILRWQAREDAKGTAVIVTTPAKERGKRFSDMTDLRAAVRLSLGMGPGWSNAPDPDVDPDAVEVVNRLHAAIEAAMQFAEGALRDNAGRYLRWWTATAVETGLAPTFKLATSGDLARLIDWWTFSLAREPWPDIDPKSHRQMAEIALRSGYWPATIDIGKEPTIADVIQHVTRSVRQIRSRH